MSGEENSTGGYILKVILWIIFIIIAIVGLTFLLRRLANLS